MIDRIPVSVVDTPQYAARVRKLMDDDAEADMVDFLARNPLAGAVIPGTGGVRKLRWRLEGRGKRGGARVIYYYHNDDIPLFLLTVYAKNEKENLSVTERNAYRRIIPQLVESYGRKTR